MCVSVCLLSTAVISGWLMSLPRFYHFCHLSRAVSGIAESISCSGPKRRIISRTFADDGSKISQYVCKFNLPRVNVSARLVVNLALLGFKRCGITDTFTPTFGSGKISSCWISTYSPGFELKLRLWLIWSSFLVRFSHMLWKYGWWSISSTTMTNFWFSFFSFFLSHTPYPWCSSACYMLFQRFEDEVDQDASATPNYGSFLSPVLQAY